MKLPFYKYQGAGNNFVLVDNRELLWNLKQEEIAKICHRRFGVGADGLMLLQMHSDFDFEMRYYNSDGKLGSMCGNGGRCIVAFAKELGIIENSAHFIASDGEHTATIFSQSENQLIVCLEMQDVAEIKRINETTFFLNTGSPHHVQYVENLKEFDVFGKGKEIRYSPDYVSQNGTNVNFVEPVGNKLFVRTYERGVEDETYSCGTGVTASALTFSLFKPDLNTVEIETLGGKLSVSFEKTAAGGFENVFLQGPAAKVFEGVIEI